MNPNHKTRRLLPALILLFATLASVPAVSADHTCHNDPELLREWCESHEGPLGLGYLLDADVQFNPRCDWGDWDCWNCQIQVLLGAWRVCD